MIGSQFGNVAIVVWREGVEALLIVGILHTWLRNNDVRGRGRLFLWAGVGLGVVAAIVFGAVIALFSDSIPETSRKLYQVVAVLIAAGLIVHMVAWMRDSGRTLRHELEIALAYESAEAGWWNMFTLAALAIGREGAETILFLVGTLSATPSASPVEPLLGAATGIALALATYALVLLGNRMITWRLFFRITEVMMLLIAASLLITGVDTLIDLHMLPAAGALWDSSALLSDTGAVGALVAGLTGYRAQPDALELATYLVYWGFVVWLLRDTEPPEAVAIAPVRRDDQP